MIRGIIEDLIAAVCLTAFLLCIYVWSTEIGAFFYD
jgi:hypothetical protein